MTWVKICGITNLEDALVAVEAGADALGFVFYEKSPRRVDPRPVREIIRKLPGEVEKIGVFVMASQAEMELVGNEAQLTGWQMHKEVNGTSVEHALREGGLLVPSECKSHTGKNVYISLPASLLLHREGYRGFDWSKGANKQISALFIDSGHGDLPGGTGQTFDWQRLQYAIQCLSVNFNVVVAGGLTPSNVRQAMDTLHPWGVDICSGVEAKPGKKDPEKIRAFIRAVRAADKANSN
jgi:phosphoribosylanthranilate isomerase